MADAFAQSFVALSSKVDQQEALIKLTGVLTSDQRQELLDCIYGRNDFVPGLPFELLLHVFSYLHILDSWRLQLVNKRWRAALTSDEFVHATLSRWHTHHPSDSARIEGSIMSDAVAGRILHMKSLHLGKPFSQVIFDDFGTALGEIVLKGSKLAYIASKPGQDKCVMLRDLITGSTHTFRGDAKEGILSLALSTDVLAFLTIRGQLYIYNLARPESTVRRQLSSARVLGLSVAHETVAVLVGSNDRRSLRNDQLLLYESRSSHSTALDIHWVARSADWSRSSYCIIVDGNKKVADLFVLCHQNGNGLRSIEVSHQRITFDGDVVEAGSFARSFVPYGGTLSEIRLAFLMTTPVPNGYRGQFRMQVGQIPLAGGMSSPSEPTTKFLCEVIFDSKAGAFLQDESRLFYSPSHRYGGSELGHALHTKWKGLVVHVAKDAQEHDNTWQQYHSLANDAFLVTFEVSLIPERNTRIRVFSFDPNLNMHNSTKTAFRSNVLLQSPHNNH